MANAALLTLKNIGSKTAAWLQDVGVGDRAALAALGPVDAYLLLKAAGYPVSPVLLAAIFGALNHMDWRAVPDEVKVDMRARAGLPDRG
jgi:hypothetical protein